MSRKTFFVLGMVLAYPAGVAVALVVHHLNLYKIARNA